MINYPWKKQLTIALTAMIVGFVFCFVGYPSLSSFLFIPFDIDKHAVLGEGLYHYSAFTYFPLNDPTIDRGPIYPIIISIIIFFTGDYWHLGIQIVNVLIFAMTCCLVFEIVRRFCSDNKAFFAGLITALYPYLIWFLPRAYVEPLSFLLFTTLTFCLVTLKTSSQKKHYVFLGILLGLMALNKQTFLPFIFFIPLFLFWIKKISFKQSVTVCLLSLLMILPWTYRNWNLTGKFIPVQGLVGYNIVIGDGLYEYFNKVPMGRLWEYSYEQNLQKTETEIKNTYKSSPKWDQEVILEKKLIHQSFQKYVTNPKFFLGKIIFNAWGFWLLGTNEKLAVWLFLMQGTLLTLFLITTYKIYSSWGLKNIFSLPVTCVWLYFLIHLPVMAGARFSTAVIPTIICYIFIAFTKKDFTLNKLD